MTPLCYPVQEDLLPSVSLGSLPKGHSIRLLGFFLPAELIAEVKQPGYLLQSACFV